MKYIRKVRLLILLLLVSVISSAQTSEQVSLVDNYMYNKGNHIVASWAHPTCQEYKYSVTNVGHMYFISITYSYVNGYGTQYFKCNYMLQLNEVGEPKSFSEISCGSPTFGCFSACNTGLGLLYFATSDEENKYAKLLNKLADNLTCEDICFGRLYFTWKDGGYYSKY